MAYGVRDDFFEAPGHFASGERYWQIGSNPDVYLVSVPFPNVITKQTNCYVVRDGDEALLIDTGAPSDESFRALLDTLDELRIDVGSMSLFLTHLHLDHAGLVDRIIGTHQRIYLSEVDFDYMCAAQKNSFHGALAARLRAEGCPTEYADIARSYGMGVKSFDDRGRNLVFVGDGDVIKVGSHRLVVVDVEGHTPGHLALYEPQAGLLFSGDHVLYPMSPGLGFRCDRPRTMARYLSNLDKVNTLGVSLLCHSHGRLRRTFDERVDWLKDHHGQRIEAAAALIAQRPGLTGYEAVRSMRWNTRGKGFSGLLPVQRWVILENGLVVLDHVVGEGLVRREVDEEGAYRYLPPSRL